MNTYKTLNYLKIAKNTKVDKTKDIRKPSDFRQNEYDDSTHYLNDAFKEKINYQGSDKQQKNDDDYFEKKLKEQLKKHQILSFVITIKKK